MIKCPELKKLPKAPRVKSVNFRRQTPGTIANLLAPRWPNPAAPLLDPRHPAAFLPRNKFCQFNCDAFRMIAYPMALLSAPDRVWESTRPIDRWEDRVRRFAKSQTNPEEEETPPFPPMILNNPQSTRVSMSFLTASAKKQTSNKRVVRLKLSQKLKTTINLIIVRGADVKTDVDGKQKLVLDEQEAKDNGDEWVLPGWSYIFHPTLKVYRMPYHDLIPLLRTGLRSIWKSGIQMEKIWETQTRHSLARTTESPKQNFSTTQTRT